MNCSNCGGGPCGCAECCICIVPEHDVPEYLQLSIKELNDIGRKAYEDVLRAQRWSAHASLESLVEWAATSNTSGYPHYRSQISVYIWEALDYDTRG